jgi:hypothetical protein
MNTTLFVRQLLSAEVAPSVFTAAFLVTPAAAAKPEQTSIVNRTGTSKIDKNFAKEAARGFRRDIALASLAEQRAQSRDMARAHELLGNYR